MTNDDDDKTTQAIDVLELARRAGVPLASLIVHHGEQVEVVPLPDGHEVVIGRGGPADLAIDDPQLSRRHAGFRRVPEGVRAEDLGSTNGTFRAGERIDVVVLAPGDSVTLGSVTITVSLASASSPQLEGIESYERFFSHLEDEVVRAATFRRPLALLMVQGLRDARAGRDETHVSRWVPRLRAALRPVDRIALYGEAAVLVLLPETDIERARSVAQAMVGGDRIGEPVLLAGAALHGRSAGERVDRARVLCRRASRAVRVALEGDEQSASTTDQPVFRSPAMLALRELAQRVAASTMPVLVQGETGSGKEVVARILHEGSGRSGPLRNLNCGAIAGTLLESQLFGHERGAFTGAERTTAGLFEQASGGTLFLDEVGELSPAAQAALLRVLETGRLTRVGGTHELEVDVRVLTATHRDLEAMVEEGTFRRDLWFRLNTMTLQVPPLRERVEDIEALTDRFLEEASRASGGRVDGIAEPARALLRAHHWPGNVRELRNVIERAVVICGGERVTVDDLPDALRGPPPAPTLALSASDVPDDTDFKDRVKAYERELILDSLRRTDGNQTQAAKLLRMPLRTLVHKLASLGIKKRFDPE